MSDASGWGWEGYHYAQPIQRAAPVRRAKVSMYSDTERRWLDLLIKAAPDTRKQVERALRQWNHVLRDYLRNETALRLSVGDGAQAVPVKIADGMPEPFADAVGQLEGMEWLILNLPLIQSAEKGAYLLWRRYKEAKAIYDRTGGSSNTYPLEPEVGRVSQFARHLALMAASPKTVQRIAGIEEDVLGAYFFQVPEIRLYWMVIGIVAATLGVSTEGLTTVVLIHELTHAYTHLGRDIDGERWDTEAFARTSRSIVEGLAQFYTGTICQHMAWRYPAAKTAFDELLKVQSGPYRAHEGWVKEGEMGGEIVRVAMIECRSRGVMELAEFVEAIRRHREGVRGRKAKGD